MSSSLLGQISNESARTVLTIAVMLLAGFLATRVTKLLRLPNVTGYILAGVLIGPFALHIVSRQTLGHMDFVTDTALAFIAFGTGRYFKFSTLKRSGWRVIVLTLFEALTAAALITALMFFVFHLSFPFALLLGCLLYTSRCV